MNYNEAQAYLEKYVVITEKKYEDYYIRISQEKLFQLLYAWSRANPKAEKNDYNCFIKNIEEIIEGEIKIRISHPDLGGIWMTK